MRFGTAGTEEHKHFQSVYANYIKSALEEEGYDCKRADDLTRPGIIVRDLLELLVRSEVCVADLTLSNPNVMYELGIRHAVHAAGNILVRDDKRSGNDHPFDVAPCRIHSYEGTAAEISSLKKIIKEAVADMRSNAGAHGDNLIHDHLQQLFHDIPSLAQGRNHRPHNSSSGENSQSPWDVILQAEQEAESLLEPKVIIARAHEIAKRRNRELRGHKDESTLDFVRCVKQFFEITVFEPSVAEYMELHWLATRLDVRKVADAIIDEALSKFPKNRKLNGRRLSTLSHSDRPADWDAAKAELTAELKLKTGKDASIDTTHAGDQVDLLGLLLDVYQRQGEHDQAFRIITELKRSRGATAFILRNYARTLDNLKKARHDDIEAAYKEAVKCENTEDTNARWFASWLRTNNRSVDALEASSLAALLDPNDAECFASLANDISSLLFPRVNRRKHNPTRELPSNVALTSERVIRAVLMSRSCRNFSVETKELCEWAMEAARVSLDHIVDHIEETGEDQFVPNQREAFAAELYDSLKSPLTES